MEEKIVNFVGIYRIVVYVPPDYVEKVKQGILKITKPLGFGDYDKLFWQSTEGTAQFVDSQSTADKEDKITYQKLIKLEFFIPRITNLLFEVVEKGIIPHHPWKEPIILNSNVDSLDIR